MNWINRKEQIIKLLNEGLDPLDIAKRLEVNEYDLRQFIHRSRLFESQRNGRNLAFDLIHLLMRGNTNYFRPNRDFFNSVKIRQKRWWALFRGEKRLTETEYHNLIIHLGITLHEGFDIRQMNLFEDLEKNNECHI